LPLMHNRKRLSTSQKVRLATRIWLRFIQVEFKVRREPLPEFVSRLASVNGGSQRRRHSVRNLARAVDRSLRLGRRRPYCLINALVLFRLLREQGDPAVLVIGLPENPIDERAHAWVELDGRDVGPPPGRSGHRAMLRLPSAR
jgi:transglutaminase superfamily protein